MSTESASCTDDFVIKILGNRSSCFQSTGISLPRQDQSSNTYVSEVVPDMSKFDPDKRTPRFVALDADEDHDMIIATYCGKHTLRWRLRALWDRWVLAGRLRRADSRIAKLTRKRNVAVSRLITAINERSHLK